MLLQRGVQIHHVRIRAALFDRLQDVRDHFSSRFRAEIAFAVHAQADRIRFEVAIADDEHGVDFHFLRRRDLGFDVIAAGVEFRADPVGT